MSPPLIYLDEKKIWDNVKTWSNKKLLDEIEKFTNEMTVNLEPYIFVEELRRRLNLNYKFPLNNPNEFGFKKDEVVKI